MKEENEWFLGGVDLGERKVSRLVGMVITRYLGSQMVGVVSSTFCLFTQRMAFVGYMVRVRSLGDWL